MFDYGAKIQALLARANHPNTPEAEAKSARIMAENLMAKYRIAEEEALALDEAAATPILHNIRITEAGVGGALTPYYYAVFTDIAEHCGVRVKTIWDNGYVARTVGYEGDVRYTEFLWTAALMMFSTRINPRWDAALTPEENIWRLRNAGIQRGRIADQAGWDGSKAADRSKVQRIYLRECERRGEPARAAGLGHQAKTFQEAYADQFRTSLWRRLREARDATDSVRGGLVLHGREDRVNEAFYTRFPDMRPKASGDVGESRPCDRCKKAKSGRCRDHQASVTKADIQRWDRLQNSPSARAGRASGHEAAEGVIIQRGHTAAQRVDTPDREAIAG